MIHSGSLSDTTRDEILPFLPRQDRRAERLRILCLFGVILSGLIILTFLQSPETHDFGLSFYHSGRVWIETGQPYAFDNSLPNMNPPNITRVLFVPLAYLPLRTAAILWTLLNIVLVALSWREVQRELNLPQPDALGALGMLLCTLGASGAVWLQGQFTWIVLFPAVRSWRAYRHDRLVAAGAWFGLVVAVKPFFAVAALAFGIVPCIAAGAVSLGVTLASIPFTGGIAMWSAWLHMSETVKWLAFPSNASLWGFAGRWKAPGPHVPIALADLEPIVIGAVIAILLALWLWTMRCRDRDARWGTALVLGVLASPLGWTHYLPLVTPALVAIWVRRQWNPMLTIAIAILCVPLNLGYSEFVAAVWFRGIVIGSIYNLSAVLLWGGLIRHAEGAARRDTPAGSGARDRPAGVDRVRGVRMRS